MKENKKTISTLFFLTVGCLAIFMAFYFVADMKRKEASIQKEIAKLINEKENFEKKNSILEEKISYLKTEDSNEKEAKQNLNYQKEDEKVVIIRRPIKEVKAESEENNLVVKKVENEPNFKIWWRYFFGKKE